MSLNWERVTLVAASKEITGSISKIYAEANVITVPAGSYFEGPIARTKTDANVVVVYHNGPLIIT